METVNGMPLDPDVSPNDRWIDVHSVTCPLCGGIADETNSIDLWNLDSYPNGEAHPNCFDFAEDNGVSKAQDELKPLVTRN